jgi:hypothetical protein
MHLQSILDGLDERYFFLGRIEFGRTNTTQVSEAIIYMLIVIFHQSPSIPLTINVADKTVLYVPANGDEEAVQISVSK